jgi:hypothetical protein
MRAKPYSKHQWSAFRAEVIELDDNRCRRCGRSAADGATLQVHHKLYVPRRLPWEYPYTDCETLCKGCHASEHGIIHPSFGWHLLGEDDLGGLSGSCEACQTEIRYVFFIHHPHWEPLAVGTDCCDRLTGTPEASEIRRFHSRLFRFISSPRWSTTDDTTSIRQKGIELDIVGTHGQFRMVMNGRRGKKVFSSLTDAKTAAYEVIENGMAGNYLKKYSK